MGRTKRRRLKKKIRKPIENLDNDDSVINLKKWMMRNKWRNDTSLKLKRFPSTGRGVTSTMHLKENDVLFSLPLDLMITYTTLQANLQELISPHSNGLKIHDLLMLFLVVEKLKKEKSLWKAYVDSLPVDLPVLPWLADLEEIHLFPDYLRIISERNRENFTESMTRVKESIVEREGCMLDENLFKWGYVLVNTRAVYIDPQIFSSSGHFLRDLLIDQPSMALCPFLDMFNHHFSANTEAKVVEKEEKLVYQLQTFTKFNKHDQIFISYGAHDNLKLLMEYGFFIPGNVLDVIKFELRTFFYVFNKTLDQKRYKFIIDHNFNTDLYVGYSGFSFNLKAVLFVFFHEECPNYNAVIFSESYPQDFLKKIGGWTVKLLNYELNLFESDYRSFRKYMESGYLKSENAKLLESFLQYRITFLNDLKIKICI